MKESRYETLKNLLLGNEYRYDISTKQLKNKHGRIMKFSQRKDGNGYVVTLKSKQYALHEVISVAAGWNIKNKKCIFVDRNNHNLELKNLRWVKNEDFYLERNRNLKSVKLDKDIVEIIRNEKELSSSELAMLCCVGDRHIRRIKSRNQWN